MNFKKHTKDGQETTSAPTKDKKVLRTLLLRSTLLHDKSPSSRSYGHASGGGGSRGNPWYH